MWTVTKDKMSVVHDSGAKITLVPAESGRNGRHYILRVRDDWIYQGRWIRQFHSLESAKAVAEKLIQLDK